MPNGTLGKHRITRGTQWSNIIFAKQMHHIAAGDASFDKFAEENKRFPYDKKLVCEIVELIELIELIEKIGY